MARLSSYGLAVTVVCQANAAYLKWTEGEAERRDAEERRKAKELRRNPKKKHS